VIDGLVTSAARLLPLDGVTDSGVFWRLGEWRAAEGDAVDERAPGGRATGPDELERRGRVGRRWVRELVTTRLGLEWRGFAPVSPGGKPRLLDASGADASISHSDGALLVGVAASGLVGVDIEEEPFEAFVRPPLLRRMCSVQELAAVDGLAEPIRRRALARAWTVKEASLKALGCGLARDPRDIAVDLDALAALGLRQGPEWTIVHVTAGATLVRHPWTRKVVAGGSPVEQDTTKPPPGGGGFHGRGDRI
jgi:phosphopantetheinyl transferase